MIIIDHCVLHRPNGDLYNELGFPTDLIAAERACQKIDRPVQHTYLSSHRVIISYACLIEIINRSYIFFKNADIFMAESSRGIYYE